MALKDITDQQDAVQRLQAAMRADRVAHAYLLVGPKGVGRLQLARELARALLCGDGAVASDSCGVCKDCTLFDRGRHPDYVEIGVPEGKQELPIDLVRHLQDSASIKPLQAARRVFVLREVERMNAEAANCLLKTLEEPPGACVIILVATTLRDLPPTLVSRCRVVRLRSLPPQRVCELLEAEGTAREDAWWLARRSWGSPGLARAFRDTDLHGFNRELVGALAGLKVADNFHLSDWLEAEASRRANSRPAARLTLQELLECVAVFYRDLAVLAAGAEGVPLHNSALGSTSQRPSAEQLSTIIERAEAVLETIERVGANANRQLALDDLFTRLARKA